jgi:hypothetical protein
MNQIFRETIRNVIDNCLKLCGSAIGDKEYNFVKQIWQDDNAIKNLRCFKECHEYIAELKYDYLSIEEFNALKKELDRMYVELHGVTIYKMHTCDGDRRLIVTPSLCLTMTYDPRIEAEMK